MQLGSHIAPSCLFLSFFFKKKGASGRMDAVICPVEQPYESQRENMSDGHGVSILFVASS